MQVELKADDKQVQELLAQVAARVSDMRPVMAAIGETIATSVRRNFTSGGRSNKWRQSKRVKAAGGKTLMDTGVLKNSIHVDTVERDSVTVGTADKRAAVLHFGAKKGSFGTVTAKVSAHERTIRQAFGRVLSSPKKIMVSAHDRKMKLPWGDIPARPFMMVQPEDWHEIIRMLSGYLETGSEG